MPNETNIQHPGGDTMKAVELLSPMTIAPGTQVTVRCSAPFQAHYHGVIEPLTIHAPIATITAPASHLIKLVPSNWVLGPEFAKGWKRLPDELKAMILKFNLVSGGIFYHPQLKINYTCPQLFLKHLAMGPEIAALSQEIYYTCNTFSIYSPLGSSPSFYYPKPAVNHLVRRLQLQVAFAQRQWRYLRKLAKGRYGFHNLRHVKINMKWIGPLQDPRAFLPFIERHKVHFKCAGELEIEDSPEYADEIMRKLGGFHPAYVERRVRKRIKFQR